ncbi:bursicon isoform X1 [Cydia pomonella]|uniref:Bursicon n=1 Tax=Cydia pomonella TaxID=82600 RepID=A0A514YLK1_CYDPO|nr:bursicon isoform X1 [Cydia pomonella]QDK59883.1 bursicon alpha [Cydia pomonella]
MIHSHVILFSVLFLSTCQIKLSKSSLITQEVELPPGQECVMTPVVHVLKHPGCQPQLIPSYACVGKCTSYLQVSGSKIWQMERSCNCCQESGEREATVDLYCPEAKKEENRYRKVVTKAPLECMCRPCGIIDSNAIIPQETVGYAEEGPLHNHFRKSF